MAREGRLRVEIERVTGKQDQFKQIVKETEAFYKRIESNPLDIELNDIKGVIGQLQQIREEYDKIINDTNSNNGMIDFAKVLEGVLSTAEDKFANIGVMFKNVHDNASKYVTGLYNIISHLHNTDFGVKFFDATGHFNELQRQAQETFDKIKSIGRDTTYDGKFSFYDGSFNQDELERRIDLLKELQEIQQNMMSINSNLQSRDFISGSSVDNLSYIIKETEKKLVLLRKSGLETTEELQRQRMEFTDALDWSDHTWNDDDFRNAKDNIADNEYYERSLEQLKAYINDREQLLHELNTSKFNLFHDDEIDSMGDDLRRNISEAKDHLKILEDLKGNNKGSIGNIDFTEVIEQLHQIAKVIQELKDNFKPLTDAFADGGSALSKMVTASIDDLNGLITKFDELHQMVDTISNKQFNVNNIISNGNNTQNDLEQIRQFRKEAKELYSQVQDLYVEATTTSNKIKRTPVGLQEVLNFSNIMGDFDFNDIGKRIKSRSAASLAIVVDELSEWKKILLQFNELRNKTEAGSFDGSKYKSTASRSDSTIVNKTDTDSIIDENAVDDHDILNKVKTLNEQVFTEFTSIRSKMEEVFDFSTLNFNDEFIKSKTEQVYQQFVDLQSKINALELKLDIPTIAITSGEIVNDTSKTTSTDNINKASEAIKEEGNEAEQAAKKKQEFLEANQKVAKSGSETKTGIKEATQAIKEEGDAAEDSAKRIAMAKQAVSSFNAANKNNVGDTVKLKGLTQADFELYADEVAKSKGLTVGDISVSIGENGNMMVASVQMLNEELAQSITYTYKLAELEEGVAEAYLTGYRAKGNQNKALKIAAAEQKKADAERLKADKARAKNNQWLIQQQAKLDTQERKYKYSNKSIDGSTTFMSVETSLADNADKTIDNLAQHIRERIKSAMSIGLSDELKEQILNDLRILQNEISVQQSIKYSATNMKASNVETNKKAYAEYLNAFEANAKKGNVFPQMEASIKSLRDELSKVTDSSTMDKFIDNLKVARNKLQAEKAEYAAQTKESKDQQKQEKEQLTGLVSAYKEYAGIIEKIQTLRNKSELTGENYSQTISGLQQSADAIGKQISSKYGVNVASQDKLLDSLSKNNILSQEQMNTLLEEDIKHRERIAQLARETSDAKVNAASKKHAQEQEKQNKEQLDLLIKTYKEYADIMEKIQILENRSQLKGENHSQTIGGLRTSADYMAKQMNSKYGIDVTSQNALLDSLSKNNILTQEQMNALLEKDIKHREKIVQLVREASDAESNAAHKKLTQEQEKQNRQNQSYGKTQYNREAKYLESITAKIQSIGEDKISDVLSKKIEQYKGIVTKLEGIRNTFATDPKAFADDGLKNQFQGAALEAENLRKEILVIYKESDKLSKIPTDALLGVFSVGDTDITKLKHTMLEYIAMLTDGQFKFKEFGASGTEMYGVLDKGNGIIQEVTVALDRGTNALYAYQSGTKQVSSSWQKISNDLQSGVKQLVGMYLSFHDVIRIVRQGLTYVKEIDLALTELKKVTDETDESYQRFLKTAASTSGVIGSTISDFTDATANFARLGYTIDEAAQMAETAIVYKNVADGLDTVEESTESIISTMMAFGIQANDTMSIIDRFNAVGKCCPCYIAIYN